MDWQSFNHKKQTTEKRSSFLLERFISRNEYRNHIVVHASIFQNLFSGIKSNLPIAANPSNLTPSSFGAIVGASLCLCRCARGLRQYLLARALRCQARNGKEPGFWCYAPPHIIFRTTVHSTGRGNAKIELKNRALRKPCRLWSRQDLICANYRQ